MGLIDTVFCREDQACEPSPCGKDKVMLSFLYTSSFGGFSVKWQDVRPSLDVVFCRGGGNVGGQRSDMSQLWNPARSSDSSPSSTSHADIFPLPGLL